MNSVKIAAALRALADAFEDNDAGESTPAQPAATPVKRGRGRPVVGETAPSAAPAASPEASDPFAAEAPAAPAAPTVTLDQVRAGLVALKAASGQDVALAALKTAGGVDNLPGLKPDKYDAVLAACAAALCKQMTVAPVPEPEDPFAMPAGAPAPEPEKALTIEDVKKVIVETQKRTGSDTAQKVVMKHGGSAPKADGTGAGPSLKALPPGAYAAVVAELKGLPTTK